VEEQAGDRSSGGETGNRDKGVNRSVRRTSVGTKEVKTVGRKHGEDLLADGKVRGGSGKKSAKSTGEKGEIDGLELLVETQTTEN